MQEFTQRVIEIITSIPRGKVLSYGKVALLAGNPKGARQVARILHSSSQKYDLPWHRVVNSQGRISLPEPHNKEQRILLEKEGVVINKNGAIDKELYFWQV